MAKLALILVSLVVAASSSGAAQATTRDVVPPDNIELQEERIDVAAGGLESVGGSRNCTYEMKVKTGFELGAGTRSTISFTLILGRRGVGNFTYAVDGEEGVEKGIPYFGTGLVGTFWFRSKCLDRPCRLRIESDLAGWGAAWLCDWVSIKTTSGYGHRFRVGEWIGTRFEDDDALSSSSLSMVV